MGLLTVLAVVWAVAAGISVTLQLGGSIVLNDVPLHGLDLQLAKLHAFHVSMVTILVGAFWLSALSLLQGGPPPKRPARPWSLLGGVVILPTFVTTPAAESLGLQLVLMLLMLGMIGAALAFDWKAGRLSVGRNRALGLLLLLVGVGLEMVDAIPEVEGPEVMILIYTVGCLLAGALFAVQAKMNKRLARDLGAAARSTALCNATAFLAAIPFILYFRFGLKVYFEFNVAGQWWIWLLSGLQSAFYTYSLSKIPKFLGYSAVFVLVLTGKLSSSAFADTIGLFKPPVLLSPWRGASVLAMIAGAVLYTMEKQDQTTQAAQLEEQEVMGASLVDTFSFTEVDENEASGTLPLARDDQARQVLPVQVQSK